MTYHHYYSAKKLISMFVVAMSILLIFVALAVSEEAQPEYLEYKEITGYTADDVPANFFYSDSMLLVDNENKFYPELAKVSVSLAAAGYDIYRVNPMLVQMGYNYVNLNFSTRSIWDNDHVAFTAGWKYIPEVNTTLWCVVVRGTPKNAEWFSDFNLGENNGGDHQGFKLAAEEALDSLDEIVELKGKGKNVFLFTGHSRGAAVSNIMAARYTSKYQTFGYTFACPAVSTHADNSLQNIYNINNKGDVITILPLEDWGYRRNGKTYEFAFSNAPVFTTHYYQSEGSEYGSTSDSIAYTELLKAIVSTEKEYFDSIRHFGIMLLAYELGGKHDCQWQDLLLKFGGDYINSKWEKIKDTVRALDIFNLFTEEEDDVKEAIDFINAAVKVTVGMDAEAFEKYKEENKNMLLKIADLLDGFQINNHDDFLLASHNLLSVGSSTLRAMTVIGCVMDICNNSDNPGSALDHGHNHTAYLMFVNHKYFGFEGYKGSNVETVDIPDEIQTIGSGCFYNCSSLTSVTTPSSLKYIGSGAFCNCSSLTSINTPSSLIYIGSTAFYKCSSLSSYDMSDTSIKYIGSSAFEGCSSLLSMTIPETVNILGPASLAGLTNLEELTIPVEFGFSTTIFRNDSFEYSPSIYKLERLHLTKGKTGIMPDMSDDYRDQNYHHRTVVYSSLSSLTTVTLDDAIHNIGSYTFCDSDYVTNDMESFTINLGNITKIGEYAFMYHKGLGTVNLPEGMVYLGEGCFFFAGIKSIRIPSTIVRIPDLCFCGSALEKLTIPETIEECGNACFAALTNLTELTVPVEFALSSSIFVYPHGSHYYINANVKTLHITKGKTGIMPDLQITSGSSDGYYERTIPFTSGGALKNIIIDEGIQNIGDYAFYNESGISSTPLAGSVTVSFPSTLKKIGKSAFAYQSRLLQVELPEGLIELGNSCFANSGVNSVSFPSSLIAIPASCFWGCKGLVSLDIPDTIEEIGTNAFTGTTNLKSIRIPAGLFSSCGIMSENLYYGKQNVQNIYIKKGKDGIIPDLDSCDGTGANDYKRTISSVCRKSIRKIEIEEGVKHIGAYAFYDIAGPCEINIPGSTESIGKSAFSQCVISSVSIGENRDEWKEVNIDEDNNNLIMAIGPFLTVSTDGSSYDYADDVTFTVTLAYLDGSVGQLISSYPNPTISAVLITDEGEEIDGFSWKNVDEYSFANCFPLLNDELEPGNYRILVRTNAEGLIAETEPFIYTADKSKLPSPLDCQILLTADQDSVEIGDNFTMTAFVTDSHGEPARGIKVLFVILDDKENAVGYFTDESENYAVSGYDGMCSLQCVVSDECVMHEGEYLLRVLIADGTAFDEKAIYVIDNVSIPINSVIFPDDNFRSVIAAFDSDHDLKLSPEEIEKVTMIDCSGKNIIAVEGIQHFTSLAILDVSKNQLSSLDMGSNTELTELYCGGNQLTSLELSDNLSLEKLNCSDNLLTLLNVSNNPSLEWLWCNNNQLTELNVNNNAILSELFCTDNQLLTLDMSNNPNLKALCCDGNRLTDLNLNNCVALEYLNCSENVLTTLDISQNPVMTDLWCQLNQLSELSISKNPFLVRLAGTTEPVHLNNCLEYHTEYTLCIDDSVSLFMNDTSVEINSVYFPDPYFRNVVRSFDTNSDMMLSHEEISAITVLDFYEPNVSSMTGIQYFTSLTEIDVCGTSMTTLDVRNNPELIKLWCPSNQLTSLDVSANALLKEIDCSGNQLLMLNVNNNPALEELRCGDNQLMSLDLSANQNLRSLFCSDNQLKKLNLSSNLVLEWLSCDSNQLTDLDVSNNTALNYILCRNNQLTSLALGIKETLIGLYCEGNKLTALDISECPFLVELVNSADPVQKDNYLEYYLGYYSNELHKYVQYTLDCDGSVKLIVSNNTYRITFDSCGGNGKMDPIIINADSSCTLPENAFVRYGFHFAGWRSDSGEVYADQGTIEFVHADLTLNAQWDVDEQQISLDVYDLTSDYNMVGGMIHFTITPSVENTFFPSDDNISGAFNLSSQGACKLQLTAIPDNGYVFIGWFMGTQRDANNQTLLPTCEAVSFSPEYSTLVEGHGSCYRLCAVFAENRTLDLPSALSEIGAEAFEGSSATIVNIPSACVSIGDAAFRNSSVCRVSIPAGCELGENVFDGCGIVVLVSTEGSFAQTYCIGNENCVFEKAN